MSEPFRRDLQDSILDKLKQTEKLFQAGHREGYKAGYRAGYSEVIAKAKQLVDESFKDWPNKQAT